MIPPQTDKKLTVNTGEDFLGRWSRRKQQALSEQKNTAKVTTATPVGDIENIETHLPTDADMPPIESLTEDSDYSGFLSPKVSEALRKQALRKLFQSPVFNICDGLDDYDGDYTKFEKLGNIVTADMKHQIEMEAQRHLQALAEAESLENKEETELTAVTTLNNDNDASEEAQIDSVIESTIDDDSDTEVII